jgi:eukaryotic-like serine/threonine-protein kinase
MAEDRLGHSHRDGRAWSEPVQFGPYLLLKRLAVGGMSEVYLAKPTSGRVPAAQVIIKRLLPGLLDEAQSRSAFETEARVHMAARHPNVVEVFEAGEVDGEPYLAMEYVSGVDTFRLMRRAQSEMKAIAHGVAIYIARELLRALSCVHQVRDEGGVPLGIVHRDVTPSNIYLSDAGAVKLGDFGIARSLARAPAASQALKGKYAYLAPEQVSGEPFDHRADLFSLAVVLSELLIGQALFPGAGQLAVLLAIRDCRIDPLRASAHQLPRGLLPVLERALSRSPDSRYASADELCEELARFELPSRDALKSELAQLVRWAGDSGSLARRLEGVLRDSGKMPAVRVRTPLPERIPLGQPIAPAATAADVRMQDGRIVTAVPFAKLIELIVTGQLCGEDEVRMGDQSFQRVESIQVLARHLPPSTATTHRLDGPGVPDYAAELATSNMLEILSWVLVRRETGALFADRRATNSTPPAPPAAAARNISVGEPAPAVATRKELYFDHGKIVLVASSEPSELLGESLVRQGRIDRAELDLALAAMPRYDGRLGDTLIGLGLVDPVDVFRAIQNQGRARVAEMFRWQSGRISFYRGVVPARVDFRLDLDIPELMLLGLELSTSEASLRERFRGAMRSLFVPIRPPPPHALAVSWPSSVMTLVGALGTGRTLGEILSAVGSVNDMTDPDALRALEVALAGGIVEKRIQSTRVL